MIAKMEAYPQTSAMILRERVLLAIDLASAENDIITYLSYAIAVIERIEPIPPNVAKVPDTRQPEQILNV